MNSFRLTSIRCHGWVWGLVGLLGLGCATPAERAEPVTWVTTSTAGMVASDSIYASQAGAEILRQGGNAVDAAVATSFALGVVRPYSTGLGGGGFAILRLAPSGKVVALDFRERAPSAASRDMFMTPRTADAPPPSQVGGLAVAVPGLLMGQINLLRSYGVLSARDETDGSRVPGLRQVIAPAIRLAEQGFSVDQHYVDACTEVFKHYQTFPQLRDQAGYVWRVHLGEGSLPEVGDGLRQPELARALHMIAEQGPSAFYGGSIGQSIVAAVRGRGGIMTLDDLSRYELLLRRPIISTYRDTQLISFPPPSSGGIALAQALNILETVDLPSLRERDPGLAAHWTIEALKHAFADRARWLGDPDFVQSPMHDLTRKAYGRQLARRILPDRVGTVESYGTTMEKTSGAASAAPPDDAGTSHFCVVDQAGNCVVWTETINTTFGSLVASDDFGIILNNEMDDFSAHPGQANAYGLMQYEHNAVGPNKRPLSSMSPTIITRNGIPVLLVGGSGGPRIISSVLQVLINVVDYNISPEKAVKQVRFHHQWLPDQVVFDNEPNPQIVEELERRGHRIASRRQRAVIQAIAIENGRFVGVSDPRKGGAPWTP